MGQGRYHIGDFVLDCDQRQLLRDGEPVDLSPRYFDALAYLAHRPEKLVTKEQLHENVWRGVPVTDEALTQCIRVLRRALGDKAASPAYIETVPKHGYRLIAPVRKADMAKIGRMTKLAVPELSDWRQAARLALAGTIGAAMAGALGGLLYGVFVFASRTGGGALSAMAVIFAVTTLTCTVGGFGVSMGIALSEGWSHHSHRWTALGGALGGMVIGGLVGIIASDALRMLFGRTVNGIAGAGEGFVLGGAVGLAAGLALMRPARWFVILSLSASVGAAAGVAIILLEGRLMLGSLQVLLAGFPDANLRLASLPQWLNDSGWFAPVSGAFEGAVFASGIVGAMTRVGLAWRNSGPSRQADPPYQGISEPS